MKTRPVDELIALHRDGFLLRELREYLQGDLGYDTEDPTVNGNSLACSLIGEIRNRELDSEWDRIARICFQHFCFDVYGIKRDAMMKYFINPLAAGENEKILAAIVAQLKDIADYQLVNREANL